MSLHMSSVTEVDSALSRAFVRPVLQTDHCLSGPQLLLREVPFVLIGLFGSYSPNTEFRRLSGQRLQTDLNRSQVLLFPQIDGLELLFCRDSQFGCAAQEELDVLHALECHLRLIVLLDRIWLDGVDQTDEE